MTKRELLFSAVSAVGAMVLTTIGSVTADTLKADREQAEAKAGRVRAKEEAEEKAIQGMADAYSDLGDLPRRAAEFAETGKVGSAADVRVVYNHLSRVIALNAARDYSMDKISREYAPVSRAWRARFLRLGEGKDRWARQFSDRERKNFTLIGPALGQIAGLDANGNPLAKFYTDAAPAMMRSEDAATSFRRQEAKSANPAAR